MLARLSIRPFVRSTVSYNSRAAVRGLLETSRELITQRYTDRSFRFHHVQGMAALANSVKVPYSARAVCTLRTSKQAADQPRLRTVNWPDKPLSTLCFQEDASQKLLLRSNRLHCTSSATSEAAEAEVPKAEAVDGASPSAIEPAVNTNEKPKRVIPAFTRRLRISDIKDTEDEGVSQIGKEVDLRGWVRTVRSQKAFSFIEVRTPHERKKIIQLQCR